MTKKVEKRVPDIRFKGFTDDWEQRKLGEVLSKFDYGLNTASTNYDGQNKYLRITDIDDNSHLFLKDNLTSPSNLPINKKNYQLKKGDMVFARTGASVGKTYKYLSEDGKVYFAGFLIRGRVKGKNDIGFVFNTTLQDSYKNFVKVMSIRSGQPGINSKEYQKHKIYVPKFNEQRELSNFISKLDKAIALQQKKLEQLKQFKKAMLQQIFPDKDGKLQIRFTGFTDAWEQRKLGDIATFSKGSGYSKADLKNSGTPVILYGRLYTNYELVINSVNTFTSAKNNSVYSKGGEVIVPASGETAKDISIASVVNKPNFLLGGDLNIIHPSKNIKSVFLAVSISNGETKKDMARRAQGKSIVHLHNTDLSQIKLAYPSETEQKKIDSYFLKFDSLIALHQRKLDHLKLLKKFLLQKMFI